MRDRIIIRCFNINSRTYRHLIRGIIISSGNSYIEILRHISTNIQIEKDISIISSPPFKVISIDRERSQLHSIYKCGSRHFRDVPRDFYHYIIGAGSQKFRHINTQGNTGFYIYLLRNHIIRVDSIADRNLAKPFFARILIRFFRAIPFLADESKFQKARFAFACRYILTIEIIHNTHIALQSFINTAHLLYIPQASIPYIKQVIIKDITQSRDFKPVHRDSVSFRRGTYTFESPFSIYTVVGGILIFISARNNRSIYIGSFQFFTHYLLHF